MKIKNLLALFAMLPLFLFADQTLNELSKLPILNQQNIKVVKYEKLPNGFFMVRTQIIATMVKQPWQQSIPIKMYFL
ncbi:MAG: hypothetical protein ACPGUI_00335 [Halarcobacter sp.]